MAQGQSIVTSNKSNTYYTIDRKLPKGRCYKSRSLVFDGELDRDFVAVPASARAV